MNSGIARWGLILLLMAVSGISEADHEEGPLHFSQVIEPGFIVSPVAIIAAPTAMTFDDDGALYVASLSGTITRHRQVQGEFLPPEVVAHGLESPQGIDFGVDGRLYVASIDADNLRDGRVWGMVSRYDVPSDIAVPVDGEKVLVDIPGGVHTASGLTSGPDGKIYVGNGSATINGFDRATETNTELYPLTLAILRFDPDDAAHGALSALRARGTGVPEPDPVDVVAHGVHTPQAISFRGNDLYTVSNAPHEQDTFADEPILRLVDAPSVSLADDTHADFGSPGCLYDHDDFGWPIAGPSNFPDLPEEEKGCDGVTPPVGVLGIHRGVTGHAFAPGSFTGFAGDLFVAQWGNLPEPESFVTGNLQSAPLQGHKVVRVGIGEDGAMASTSEGFADQSDFLVGVDPIDIEFDGSDLYVADFGAGLILRVSRLS